MSSAGCAGTESPASGPNPGSGPSPQASAQNSCGGIADKVKQHLNRTQVETVKVEGQCTTVVVATTLADEDTATAKQLCDAAAGVAYVGDINSIRVLGKSGRELSNGITGMKCL